MRIVRDYLAIEQVPFGQRLQPALAIEPGIESVLVPRFSLQTLHGEARRRPRVDPTGAARPNVREIAAKTGIDITRVSAAAEALSGSDLERAAEAARQISDK